MRQAYLLIFLFGFVSLFSDITYEGMRSVIGPYLSSLGATGWMIGFVTGLGEFIGYTVRLLSGVLSDRTGRMWLIVWSGYLLNLCAVPLLALAHHWELAALLLILERLGKALRTPGRDAILSYAAHQVGRGFGFGVHEAMDRIGGLLGPLLVFFVQLWEGGYRISFVLLGIPAGLSLCSLLIAQKRFPSPQTLEPIQSQPHSSKKFPVQFWLYMAAISCIALGFINYPLLGYFFSLRLPAYWSPLFYGVAVMVSGGTSLLLGKLYDRWGMSVIFFSTLFSALFAPLVFSSSSISIFLGMALWGIGWGSQGSILRAAVGRWIASNHRATAYGILNFSLGVFSFLGGILMGFLIDQSLFLTILFSLVAQFAALPLLFLVGRYENQTH